MIDLLNLAELSLGGAVALFALRQRAVVLRLRALAARPPRPVIEDGSMAWSWEKSRSTGRLGHRCPKCETLILMRSAKGEVIREALQFCECPEYHTSHYHFTCERCSYKTIMRTADDPRNAR